MNFGQKSVRIRLGQTVSGTSSVADNGFRQANNQVCVVTDSCLMDTFSLKYFFKKWMHQTRIQNLV